jgi:ABC-type Zn2+ transport system substrate-binding protein/surface adhesin
MKITSLAMAAGLSAVFAASSFIPAQALQMAPPQIEKQANANVVQVKAKWKHRRGHYRGRHHHGRYRHGHYRHGHRHHGHGHGGGWGWPFWIAPTIVIAP